MSKLDKLRTLIPIHLIENSAQQQIYTALDLDFLMWLVIMPDVHAGYSLPIGGIALLDGVISPAYVGYDIGCGMCLIITDILFKDIIKDLKQKLKIFDKIYDRVPCGVGLARDMALNYDEFQSSIGDKDFDKAVNSKMNQLGTLGSGNHFIEIGMNKEGFLCITIHSGSRKPGWLIGDYYMKLSKKVDKDLPKDFLHLDGEFGQHYLRDMRFGLDLALANRKAIMVDVLDVIGLKITEIMRQLNRMENENHNHAEVLENGVLHRKGATPAHKGQIGVIPGNMKSGVYVTRGLGNEEYLNSASHGAGRKMSRNEAKKKINMKRFQSQVKGVVCKVDHSTLEEAPDAYKDLDEVIRRQEGIVIETVDFIKPIINVKG